MLLETQTSHKCRSHTTIMKKKIQHLQTLYNNIMSYDCKVLSRTKNKYFVYVIKMEIDK